MAQFTDTFKEQLRTNVRTAAEDNLGIIGETMRIRREKAEEQKRIQEEVKEIRFNTGKITETDTTLIHMEKAFTQISMNVQLLAKAMDAQIVSEEETTKGLKEQQKIEKKAPQPPSLKAPALQEGVKEEDDAASLFDSIFDKLKIPTKKPPSGKEPKYNKKEKERIKKQTDKAGKAAKTEAEKAMQKKHGKDWKNNPAAKKEFEQLAKKQIGAAKAKAAKAAIKAVARRRLLASIGKMGAKSIPFVGAAVGAAFAVGKLLKGDWLGAGIEAASGLAGPLTSIPLTVASTVRDTYEEVYGVVDTKDPERNERYGELYDSVVEEAEDVLGTKLDAVKRKPEQTAAPGPAATQPTPPLVIPAPKPPVRATGEQAIPTEQPQAATPVATAPTTSTPSSLSSVATKADSGVNLDGFSSVFEKRVATMAQAFMDRTGKKLSITSGVRTNEKQKQLWDAKLAENGGDVARTRKMVAEPAPPLGGGRGSAHMSGQAIDINSKGSNGINVLAGSRDNPTGWLESFGLSRPVANEDWHIQLSATAPTADNPIKPGAAIEVPGKDGKPVLPASGKDMPEPKDPNTGKTIASQSTSVAAAKKDLGQGGPVVIVNTTNVQAVNRPPPVRAHGEVYSVVGA